MMSQDLWRKEQAKFGVGFIVSVLFFILSFFSISIYDNSELIVEEVVFLKSTEITGRGHHYLEISIVGGSDKMIIQRIDEIYLNEDLFKKIQFGDTIQVARVDENVFKLSCQNEELMNKRMADQHRIEAIWLNRLMSITAMIFFVIPMLFKKQPRFKFFDRYYALKMDGYIMALFIFLMMITFLFGGSHLGRS